MSLSLTHTDLTTRCHRFARLIADDLTKRQQENGNFALPEFYAKAFAISLWSHLDPTNYRTNINRGLDALKTEHHDATCHREFIEYALRETPGLPTETIAAVLRNAPQQYPDVANWQVLGLMNRQKRGNGLVTRLTNLAHFTAIQLRYWRRPLFLDRPNCFSAQYHAFCAALLSDSKYPRQQRVARHATDLLAALSNTHGYANLIGRGAGQSFGPVCALYALMKHGYPKQAEAILFRLEDAALKSGGLCLNLLAAHPLPDNPGPNNPETPGWYSYNRHDDYLAFAGYWLCKAAKLPAPHNHRQRNPGTCKSSKLAHFSSPYYGAQMALHGTQVFDVSGAPVIVSGHGSTAQIFMPPTGGEQDAPSLYAQDTQPLPAIGEDHFARFIHGQQIDNRVKISFELNGMTGIRQIEFQSHQMIITDDFPNRSGQRPNLFRLLFNDQIDLVQTSGNVIMCPALGIQMRADTALQIDHSATFSSAGPATRVRAPNANTANLVISWEMPNA